MAQRVTRPSNAYAHPGMVDRNPPHRSKEDVHLERQAKAMAKAQAAVGRKASINRIAELENTEREKAMDMDCHANDPKEPATHSRVRSGRKRPIDMDEGAGQCGFQ